MTTCEKARVKVNDAVRHMDGREGYVLEVCDQGPGIPEGRLNEVFNRFYSERPEGEAFGEHSGLGLSIAQQIAQGYRGDLVASNRDGACFTLTLPRAEI